MNALLGLVARLPLGWAHALGAVLGWVAYRLSSRYQRMLNTNLANAGLDHLRSSAIRETGKAVMELPRIWLRPHAYVAGLVRQVSGFDLVEKAEADGRGIIFLTPHLGCFEITAQWFAMRAPLTILYRPSRKKVIEAIMLKGRTRPNLKLASTDMGGVRRLLRALKAREAVGMLPDQVPSFGEGEWAEFFGRPAYTMTLVRRLQEATGAAVLMAFAERLPRGAGFDLHVLAPPPREMNESPVRHMNRAIEALVGRCPAQYLWGYNRYKVPAGVKPPQSPSR